jgi:uncharacterized protein (DUF697 family)
MNEVTLEVLAGLKVLVAIAKADGVVHANERLAIESALEGLELPEATTVDSLLETTVDFDAALGAIKSPVVRKQTFDSACALVFVDGEASDVERAMVEKIRDAFALKGTDPTGAKAHFHAALERAFAPLAAGDTARKDVVDEEIERFAVLAGALASISLPPELAGIHVANEARLAQRIGQLYGRSTDGAFWKTFVGNLLGPVAPRLAIASLARLASLGPSRAASAYASARAVGAAAKLYFEEDEATSMDALKKAFAAAKRAGLDAAKTASARIDEEKARLEAKKKTLDAEGSDPAEYEGRLLRQD